MSPILLFDAKAPPRVHRHRAPSVSVFRTRDLISGYRALTAGVSCGYR